MSLILDPDTQLPVDLWPRVNALCDWLSDDRVRRTLLRRGVATPRGLAMLVTLLKGTADDVQTTPALRRGVGRGKDFRWWQNYVQHVERQMLKILEDRVVRRSIARRLVVATTRTRAECMDELQRIRLDLQTSGQLAS